jgi:hypothetical protein
MDSTAEFTTLTQRHGAISTSASEESSPSATCRFLSCQNSIINPFPGIEVLHYRNALLASIVDYSDFPSNDLQGVLNRPGEEERPGETEHGADDDVFGFFSAFALLEFIEAKDGFRGNVNNAPKT